MPEYDSPSLDLELVKRVQRGDQAAFDLLVRKHQHRVAAVISRHVADRGAVEDIAQETFIRVWRAIGQFRADAQFSTWLYRIAVNTAKNYLTARSRRPPGEDIDIGDAELFDGGALLRDGDTPEHELMRHELEQTLLRAVQALPEELRLAITLREVDGMSYEAIAERMGCPIGTVRSRIFRAREAIDHEMKPLFETRTRAERAIR